MIWSDKRENLNKNVCCQVLLLSKDTELLGAIIDALCEGISLRGMGVVAHMTEVKPIMHLALMVGKLTYNRSRRLE